MRYQAAPSFLGDWERLSRSEQGTFLEVVRLRFIPACERFAADPSAPWPRSLRVKRVQGYVGVFELTWSFAGPGGRATFEFIEVQGELAIRWRRIGSYEVFGRP